MLQRLGGFLYTLTAKEQNDNQRHDKNQDSNVNRRSSQDSGKKESNREIIKKYAEHRQSYDSPSDSSSGGLPKIKSD